MKRIFSGGAAILVLSFQLFSHAGYGSEIRGYEVARREFFTQCVTNGASAEGLRGHFITVIVRGATAASLSSGTVTHMGATMALTNEGGLLVYNEFLAAAATPGSYSISVNTASGVESRAVTLPRSARRIAPARVLNISAARTIDPGLPFELRFAPLKGGGAKDQYSLRIYDSAGTLVVNSGLSAGQVRHVLASGTFQPDTEYMGFIEISHPYAIISPRNGGAYVVTSESRTTRFLLKTKNPAGEIRFPLNRYAVRESDGMALIPVQRDGSSGNVTVDYYIEAVTAQSGVNFTPVTGRLIFGDGITQQEIPVPLLDDGILTEPLVARAWLTNVTGGATLPAQRWCDWSILDNQGTGPLVHGAMLAKVSFFHQTNDTTPELSDVCAPARFYASAQPLYPGAIISSEARLPNRTLRSMTEPVGAFLEYNEDFPSRTAMDKVFRSGAYSLNIQTSAGNEVIGLRMMREPRFTVPRLLNWNEAQGFSAAAPFQLSWHPFEGAAADDQISLGIRDSQGDVVVALAEVFDAGTLPGTTTNYTLPANMLRPGERYHVNLTFRKVMQIKTTLSGTKTCTAFAHATGFFIQTLPAAGMSISNESPCCGTVIFRAR